MPKRELSGKSRHRRQRHRERTRKRATVNPKGMAASSRPAAPYDRRTRANAVRDVVEQRSDALSMSSRFACWSSPGRLTATHQQIRVARTRRRLVVRIKPPKRRPTGAPAVTTAAATRSDPSPAGRRRRRARRRDTRLGGYYKSGKWSLRRLRLPARSNDRLRSECLGAGDRRTRPECDRDRRRPPY